MKLILTITLILSVNITLSQQWEWVKKIDGIGNDYISDIFVDDSSNIYVTGRDKFSGVIFEDEVNPIIPTAYGHRDAFAAKYNKEGHLIWAIQGGGSGPDWGWGIVADNYGNVYYTGEITDTAYFGNDTLVGKGGNDVFVSKIDSDGNFVWAISFGSTGQDKGKDITMDNDGNLYCTGYIEEEVLIGTTTVGTIGQRNAYIVKIDTAGNILIVESIEPDKSVGLHIQADKNGSVYLSGYLLYDSYVAGYLVTGPSTLGWPDAFLAKFDTSLTTQWVNTVAGSFFNYGESIALSDNYVYMTGGYSYTSDFSGISLTYNGDGINSATYNSSVDTYVSKYDFDGNIQWAKGFGGIDFDYGYGIDVTYDDVIYFTGIFEDTVMFDTTQLVSAGAYDIFICKLDSNGNVIWAKRQGDYETDYSYCIAIDQYENIYNAGGYGFYGGGKYYDTIYLTNNENAAYVGKLTQHPTPYIKIDTINNCTNDTLSIEVSAITTPLTYEFNLLPANGWIIDNVYYFIPDNSNALTGQIIVSNNIYKDTVEINQSFMSFYSPTQINLGPDSSTCDYNTSILLNAPSNQSSYLWSDASNASFLNVSQSGTYWVQITDQNNCISSDTINIDFINCIGLKENDIKTNILYVQNQYIEIINKTEMNKIKIYDIKGQLIISFENINRIDVSNYISGLYFIQYESFSKFEILKFIIK